MRNFLKIIYNEEEQKYKCMKKVVAEDFVKDSWIY